MADASETFLRDALAGLTRPRRCPESISDDTGSDLFDRICAHPDYYPTKHDRFCTVPPTWRGSSVRASAWSSSGRGRAADPRAADAMEAPSLLALDIS